MVKFTVEIFQVVFRNKKKYLYKIMLKNKTLNGRYQGLEEYNRLFLKTKIIWVKETKTLYQLLREDNSNQMKELVVCKILKILSN